MASRSDFLMVLSGRLLSALIAIVSLRVITSLLDPKDFGIYALLMAFQTFCGLFLINPVGVHINRHTHAWWDEGTLLNRLARYNRYIVAVSACIAVVVVLWWLTYPGTDKNFVMSLLSGLAVGAIVYLGTWNVTFVYILNMLGFRSGSVAWMTTSSVIGLVFSTMLASQYPSAMSWVLGQAAGMAVGGAGAGILLWRHQVARGFVPHPSDVLTPLLDRQTILTFCLPLATATGFMWLQNTGYRFWVGGVWGVAELGILVIGLSISAQLWSIIEGLAMQFLNPYFFRHITEAKTDGQSGAVLSDMVNIMWPIYAVFAGFNILFAAVLLEVLTDERYHAAVAFVMFGAMIEFARCTTNLWSYAAQVQRRTKGVILPYGLGALIVWIGAISVAYLDGGLEMLAMVLVVAGMVTCATMVVLMQRMLPIAIDVRRWAAGCAVISICFVLAAATPIRDNGLYQNLGLLLVGGVLAGICMVAILWRNPALTRLLSASLRTV